MNDNFSSNESVYQSDANTWISDVPNVVPLFESVSGTGVTGSYVPTADPYAWVVNDNSGLLSIYANTEVSGASIGLITPNSTAIKMIDILILEAANWTFPNTSTLPGF